DVPTRPSSFGSRNAPGAPKLSSGSRIARPSLRPTDLEHVNIGKIPPYSTRQVGTSVRYSDHLAATLRPGCGRRCPLANPAALAVSSLDFLQGAFEKNRGSTPRE